MSRHWKWILASLLVGLLAAALSRAAEPGPVALTDWGPVIAAAIALFSGLLSAWRSTVAAREAKEAKIEAGAAKIEAVAAKDTIKETVSGVVTKLDGVMIQLDGKLQAHVDVVRTAAEALGVLKEKTRREAEDRAVKESRETTP